MEFDWIQKHILLQLIRVPSAKVSRLKPKDMPDNAFAYHLNKLVKSGIIVKTSRGNYELTEKGNNFVGKISTATNSKVDEIKTVVMLYGKKEKSFLFFKWSRQPYLGKITPLYDRVPFGKSLEQALESACNDKLGDKKEVKFKSSAIIKITKNKSLISHMNALVYEINIADSNINYESRNGQAILLPSNDPNIMKGVGDFITKISNNNEPFESEWSY